MKSLFESIQICEEKVKRAEKIKDLVKRGISIDIILQAVVRRNSTIKKSSYINIFTYS